MKSTKLKPNQEEALSAAIILAVYNPIRQHLKEQLASIFKQTRTPLEILIINDCSDFNTKQINDLIIELKNEGTTTDSNVSVLDNEENLGHMKTFLFGLDQVKSDIIFFSDQDDFWFPEKIQRCVEFFSKNYTTQCLTHDFYVSDDKLNYNNDTIMKRRVEKRHRPVETVCAGFATAVRKSITPLCKKATKQRGGHDVWIRTFGELLGFREVLKEPLAIWRRHDETHGARKALRNSTERQTKYRKNRRRLQLEERRKEFRQAELDLEEIRSWFFSKENILSKDFKIEAEERLLERSAKISDRKTILYCSPLLLPALAVRVKCRTTLLDWLSRFSFNQRSKL